MRPHSIPRWLPQVAGVFSLLALTLTQALAQDEAVTEVRTWTSSAGTTIEAAAIGIRQGKLGLRTPDGRVLAVPVSQFSAADIAFLHEHFRGNPDLPPIPGQPQRSGSEPTDYTGYALAEVHGPLEAGGGSTYYLYLPESLKKNRPAPLMVFTGAGGGNARAVSRLIPAAERCGMIIAANVESSNRNPGPTNNHDHSMNTVKHITENFPVDAKRVYFTGNSGGGATAMVNATFYEGAVGAMPMVAYLSHEYYEKSASQARHFFILGGATDFNRYVSANIATIHEETAMHRFGPGGHGAIPDDLQNEGLCWLLGRYLGDKRDDPTLDAERLDFEAAMILWIKELESDAPHRAHYWCHFLESSYLISGHNAKELGEITQRLSATPPNVRYTEGIAALDAYSREHLAVGFVGSLNGHTYPSAVAAAKKLASEYGGVPEIEELFLELSKPTVGGKK